MNMGVTNRFNSELAYSPGCTSSPIALRKRLQRYSERLRTLNILGSRFGHDASRLYVEAKLEISRERLSALAALRGCPSDREELLHSTVTASRDHIAILKALVKLTPFDDEQEDLRDEVRAVAERREQAQMIIDDIEKIQMRTAQNVTRSRCDIQISIASESWKY